ncbi:MULTISPECIES: hypothetical protein [Streptomyces]|uniref:hypothetical protein n=1 Tax=Streptomyces TaxID=1883 RepID=UPI00345C53C0
MTDPAALRRHLHRAVVTHYYRRVFRLIQRLEEGGTVVWLYRRHRTVRPQLLVRQAELAAGEAEVYENEAADVADELTGYPETPPVSWAQARTAALGCVADWSILAACGIARSEDVNRAVEELARIEEDGAR